MLTCNVQQANIITTPFTLTIRLTTIHLILIHVSHVVSLFVRPCRIELLRAIHLTRAAHLATARAPAAPRQAETVWFLNRCTR